MAVRPGEENVATLFGDVHYFYGPPTANPPHHRFDKGSYVYLFENASQRRARIEIANQPGTDDQDAFDGYRTRVQYSYKQQCLVSITVDGVPGSPIDPSQWHLPTYDPRNENKYHYKLHSLDIYFWTQTDALQFVNGIRRVLPASQIEVADEPGPPPSHAHSYSQDVNPLVQKLEKAAISDPRVQQPGVPSFAPPPTTASSGQNDSPQSFAPMAYNPAAPPEAERYQHREKTPPPEDDGHNPLAAALARDQAAPFSPAYGQTTFSHPPGAPGLPGPPSQAYPGLTSPGLPPSAVGSPGLPPTQFGHLQRSATMPAAGLASPGLTSPYGANFPGSPSFAPPPSSAAPPTQHHPTPPPVQSPGLPPPPPGGYSQFNYVNAPQAPLNPDYNIHQQLYRPTEQEHTAKYGEYKPKVEGHSKLGHNAERLERGVTGMLKKFEKKWGV
ncbi:hypothetical protein GQX73_g5492 [Xylaria multiplex]|uniref:RNA recognition motif-containing protein n=1 Tax=Xylaria multiplex TaxID=323545 RepID=A0A7C8N4H8_9PEZI|nr:hypothetical protein GQX73_g5492 [Xylaria multiplex]